jgi:hypothetical protein
MKDLNLIELSGPQRSAKFLCSACRASNRKSIDSSIPFQFLTRSSLKHFLADNQFEIIDPAVADYQKLLEMEFEDKWLHFKRKKKGVQPTLLDEKPGDRLL